MKRVLRTALGVLAASAAMPVNAQTQPATATDTSTANATDALPEIVVTAQKRSESLQTVPISVVAVTGEQLKTRGVGGVAELATIAPGLVITPNVGNPIIFLRGVGTDQFSGGTESSVATYVDGVYLSTAPSTMFSFNNVERIEVLRGPQGTLFGRNASGGLINVVTKDPKPGRSLDASVSYGSYDTVVAQAYVNQGVAEGVAFDLAGYYKDQGKGWGKNIFNGKDAYRDNTYALRSKQLLEPGAGTRIVLAEDYSSMRGSTSAGRQPLPGSFGAGRTPNTGSFFNINNNFDSYQIFKGGGASAQLEQDVGGGLQLVNLFAWRKSTFDNYLDQDATPLRAVDSFQHYTNRSLSNELQLQSAKGNPVSWIAGVYLLHMRDTLNPLTLSGTSQNANGGSQTTTASQQTRSAAGFAQATVPLGAATNVTAGLRYSWDERHFVGTVTSPTKGLISSVDAKRSWGSWNYKLSIDHQLGSRVMAYASYSTGYKSGQFNPVNPTNPPVNPEKLRAAEVGIKSQWLDNRLRLNIAGFHYDYRDIQLTQRTATGLSQILNAATAKIYGADISVLFQPVSGLVFHGDAELLHGRYTKFPNAPILVPSPAVCTPVPTTTGPLTGGNTNCSFDASGKTMMRAPDLTLDGGVRYTAELGPDRKLNFDVSAFRTSGSYFNPDNRLKQEPYTLVNASIGLEGSGVGVRVWAKNLFDKRYYSYLHESIGDYFTPGAPRTIGVTFNTHFD